MNLSANINQKIRLYILTSNICITTQYSHEECVDDAYNVSRLHLKKDLAFYLKCSGGINNVSFFVRHKISDLA